MLVSLLLCLLLFASAYLLQKSNRSLQEVMLEHDKIEAIYGPVAIEENTLRDIQSQYSQLQNAYKEKLTQLKQNEVQLSRYYLGIGTIDSVSYSSFTTSKNVAQIESQLAKVKDNISQLIKDKRACVCTMGNDIVVNNKRSEAKKLFNREIKLRLRCLDNEFKAAAAIVDWNNINRLIDRTKQTFTDINKTGDLVKTYLQSDYLNLKVQELRLTYELDKLKQELIEEQREEARLLREAEREEKKIKAAAKKAEKDRVLMEKLVAQELAKLESCSEEQKALYELHMVQLEVLKEKERRAISLAQQTRTGYVYLISNSLSFGSDVVKIGMTRRADPYDRVKELGDASVPELFDVHAFAYTEDAPDLEKFLHNQFAEKRVNLVNARKEFFYAKPEEVLKALEQYDRPYELVDL